MSVADVIPAALALARHGLVDAFGHVSARTADGFAMTPPRPLGTLTAADVLVTMPLEATELPPDAPKEAWIHLEAYRRRPDVGAVCRGQPVSVNAAAGCGVPIRALHGQGAFVGELVPVHDDAALVRDRARGTCVVEALGDGDAVVLRGNGAVTVGATPGDAMARMYVLEASARINLLAGGRDTQALSEAEYAAWRAAAPELLQRLWSYLAVTADVT